MTPSRQNPFLIRPTLPSPSSPEEGCAGRSSPDRGRAVRINFVMPPRARGQALFYRSAGRRKDFFILF
jgi:hypothetical protein